MMILIKMMKINVKEEHMDLRNTALEVRTEFGDCFIRGSLRLMWTMSRNSLKTWATGLVVVVFLDIKKPGKLYFGCKDIIAHSF